MNEYKSVLARSTAPERLERLEGMALNPDQVRLLVTALSAKYRVRQPTLAFSGKGGGVGEYSYDRMRLRLDSTGADAATFAHEYAHHLWWFRVVRRDIELARRTHYHGPEFVSQYDRVALATEHLILASSWYSFESS